MQENNLEPMHLNTHQETPTESVDVKSAFDLADTSDLPDDYKKTLHLKGFSATTKHILGLFDMKEELTAEEIWAALYRLYGTQKPKSYVSSTLSSLYKRNILKREGKVYRKNQQI